MFSSLIRLRLALCAALVMGSGSAVLAVGAVDSSPSQALRAYYASLEVDLLQNGLLRRDRQSQGRIDPVRLTQDFLEVAMNNEYGAGLSASGSRKAKPLLRWEDPVRMQVMFGPSVARDQMRTDRRTIYNYADRLARITGKPIAQTDRDANFHVIVVDELERRSLASTLPRLIPGISPWMVNTIARMRPNHLCMVIAEPHADRRRGYARAIAIVRAEHSPRMRESCIEEELAQGMGLPNDCDTVSPSIFNDDQEFAVLTRRDELLLKMLYHPDLHSGMSPRETRDLLPRIAARLTGS